MPIQKKPLSSTEKATKKPTLKAAKPSAKVNTTDAVTPSHYAYPMCGR